MNVSIFIHNFPLDLQRTFFIALLENICQYVRANAESAEILYDIDMQDIRSGRNLFNKYPN